MQVDPAEAWNCEKPRGDDLSVGNNNYGVGRDAFQKFLRRVRLDGLGLKNVQIGRERRLFYGRAAYILPPPARPVRLGDDGFDGNACFGGKTPERGYGKFRRATKDDAHGGHPRGLPLAGLPQFADTAFDQVPFEHAEMLDEKDAVQVIDFVTEGASEQAFTVHFIRFALDVLRADSYVGRAQHRAAKSGY